MASEPGGPVCEEHPHRSAERRCFACSRLLCAACAPSTLEPPPDKGYGVCAKCQRRVKPWVWNRFSAGLDEDAGDHVSQATRLRRLSMLRAGWGRIPWSSVGLLLWLGCLGVTWLLVDALAPPEMPSFQRFGLGVPWSFTLVAALATFAAALHTVQPPGDAPAASFVETAQVAATAFCGPALVWLIVGVIGLVASGSFDNRLVVYAGLAAFPVGLLWGTGVAGWGMSVRRGAPMLVGWIMAAGAMALTGIVTALVMFIYFHPPWHTWG